MTISTSVPVKPLAVQRLDAICAMFGGKYVVQNHDGILILSLTLGDGTVLGGSGPDAETALQEIERKIAILFPSGS